MRIGALAWCISMFVLVAPCHLWAQNAAGTDLQIVETGGSFGRFLLGSQIRGSECIEQVDKNTYRSESAPALILTDQVGNVDEIVVTGQGIFTQRYVSIGQSTMRDVLQRYGTADIDSGERFIQLTYPNLVFFFDKPSGKSDPLVQTVKFITLKRSSSRVSQAITAFYLSTSTRKPDHTQCDLNLWNHVYHPTRLIVNQQCICVTGTIVDATNGTQPDGVRREADGDAHGWLKVDAEFQNLLNDGNISAQDGNLVFEIVCRFPVRQKSAIAACADYEDKLTLPPLGSRVRIMGVYVQDTFHAQWMEIHPVTSITAIR